MELSNHTSCNAYIKKENKKVVPIRLIINKEIRNNLKQI